MAKIVDIRGSAAGVHATDIVDGQRLYDLENRKLYIDRVVDDTPERVEMSLENEFVGTKDQWGALSEKQKSVYKSVTLTDDYEFESSVFDGATALEDGSTGIIPAPTAGQQDYVLRGDGNWKPFNVDDTLNTSSANPIQNKAVKNALDTKADKSEKGVANGYAELDETGKIPVNQLPGAVNLLEKYPTMADFPAVGGDNTMYVALDTNFVYRWIGTGYVQIDASIQIGETSQTAFRGDYGKLAYMHAVTNKGIALASNIYKIVTNAEGHITSGTPVTKSDITDLGIPGSDTTYSITEVDGGDYASLLDFVMATAKGKVITTFNFEDTDNIFGFGTSAIIKGIIQYENAYDGSTDVKGNGMVFIGSSINPYWITLTGASNFTLTKQLNPLYENKPAASGGVDVSLVTTGDKYKWNQNTSNTGTVTKLSTGAGLVGGDVTTTGTIKANLKSETKSSLAVASRGSTSGREYPVGLDVDGKLGVNVPWTDTRDFKLGTSRSGASNNTLYFIRS